jgi:excisionase family DNA binding protein
MKAKLLGGATRLPVEVTSPEAEAVGVDIACQVLGIGRTKLYELMGDGTLPSVKFGRRRLVRLDTARRVLAEHEHAGMHRGRAA